jgi:hypothetical protein
MEGLSAEHAVRLLEFSGSCGRRDTKENPVGHILHHLLFHFFRTPSAYTLAFGLPAVQENLYWVVEHVGDILEQPDLRNRRRFLVVVEHWNIWKEDDSTFIRG